ncbi:unnamed protein product [Arabidopsis arenosa]|uniref:Annexin n=1 Tax=Arabidopsis arenosa TaxID=38785 RepID=A0A8S2AJS4_ARAAE|nr:unnamed protein product [Arabidopsis arenosa]
MASLKVPANVPLPEEDAEQLNKAFKGWGTNEGMIISILAHRNAPQRSFIRAVYAANYNKDLLKELDRELSGDFERAVMLWTFEPAERDAYLAKESTKIAKQAYQARYKTSLEEDVAYHTSGDIRKLLVPLVSTFRYDGDEVNMVLARILTTRSKAQISATLNHYKNNFGTSMTKYLKEHSENEYIQLLKAVIKCLTYPEKYFEKVLRQAINKLGTDEWGTYESGHYTSRVRHGTDQRGIFTQKQMWNPMRDDHINLGSQKRSTAQLQSAQPSKHTMLATRHLPRRMVAYHTSGHVRKLLVPLVSTFRTIPTMIIVQLLKTAIKCLTYPEKYFEKVLRRAINKIGTDEWALTRVVTTRAEVDMERIKEEILTQEQRSS